MLFRNKHKALWSQHSLSSSVPSSEVGKNTPNGPLGNSQSTQSSLGVCRGGSPLGLPARSSDRTLISNFISLQSAVREQSASLCVEVWALPYSCVVGGSSVVVGNSPPGSSGCGWFSLTDCPRRAVHWFPLRYQETLPKLLTSLRSYRLIMPWFEGFCSSGNYRLPLKDFPLISWIKMPSVAALHQPLLAEGRFYPLIKVAHLPHRIFLLCWIL